MTHAAPAPRRLPPRRREALRRLFEAAPVAAAGLVALGGPRTAAGFRAEAMAGREAEDYARALEAMASSCPAPGDHAALARELAEALGEGGGFGAGHPAKAELARAACCPFCWGGLVDENGLELDPRVGGAGGGLL